MQNLFKTQNQIQNLKQISNQSQNTIQNLDQISSLNSISQDSSDHATNHDDDRMEEIFVETTYKVLDFFSNSAESLEKSTLRTNGVTQDFSNKTILVREPQIAIYDQTSSPNPRERNPTFINPNLVVENPTIMVPANQTVSHADALNVIPEVDESNIPINIVLRGCNEAKAILGEAAEGNLVKVIRTRISGEALEKISGQNFPTIEDLSNYLKEIYTVSMSVKQLLGDLGNEYQREDENVVTFANRIKDIGNRI